MLCSFVPAPRIKYAGLCRKITPRAALDHDSYLTDHIVQKPKWRLFQQSFRQFGLLHKRLFSLQCTLSRFPKVVAHRAQVRLAEGAMLVDARKLSAWSPNLCTK